MYASRAAAVPCEPEALEPPELLELGLDPAEAVDAGQAGVVLGAGLLVLTQVLPFQYHHRQLLFC